MAKRSRRVANATAATRATARATTAGNARPTTGRARKETRRAEYEKQQRQWLYTKIGIGVVVLAIVGGIGWGGWNQYQQWMVTRDVESYFSARDFVGQHVDNEPIFYEQIPPVGGPHRGVPLWQNCGFYDGYIETERGVHSMEHGAVWITYDPGLPQDQIDALEAKTDQQYVLVSAYPGLPSPVVASVWGKQIFLDGAGDSRLDAFIREYRGNPDNTPEPGGLCWAGVSTMTDVEPQQDPYIRADPDGPPVGGVTASQATATAMAEQPVPPATPQSTPVNDPAATPPAGTPVSSPVASPVTQGPRERHTG